MATISFQSRIEDVIGTSISDTSGLNAMLEGTVAEITSILPDDVKLQHAILSTSSDVEGKEIFSISRGGYYATEIPKGLSTQASDTNSIHRATAEAPVYYFENSQINIIPSGGETQILAYEQPSITFDASSIPNFPKNAEYAVVLGSACKELNRMISTSRDALPTVVPEPVINYTDASVGDGISTAQDAAVYAGPGTDLTALSSGTAGTTGDMVNFNTWFDIVAEYIETDEDTELARASLEKIQSYIAAFRADLEDSSNASQVDVAKMTQSTGAAIAKMGKSSDINVQNAAQALQASIAEYSQVISKYQQDMARSTMEIGTLQRQHDTIYASYQQQLGLLSKGALKGGGN